MSLYDYKIAREIVGDDPPFYSLIMAALLKADSFNAAKLRAQWPHICEETQARYDAPGAALAEDSD